MDWITIGAAIRVATIWGLQIEREGRKRRERAKEDEVGRRLGLKPRGSHVVVSCSPPLPP